MHNRLLLLLFALCCCCWCGLNFPAHFAFSRFCLARIFSLANTLTNSSIYSIYMTSFAPSSGVTTADVTYNAKAGAWPHINKIAYEGEKSRDPLAFKHYNASEVVHGKTMAEWTRFSVCYWHTFRGVGADPFGGASITRPWDDLTASVENAKRRIDVAFEFFVKLGVAYYTFHDVDVSPEGKDLAEVS